MQDLHQDFWRNILLSLDGWMLEKKMAFDDAKILRDMAWRRESRIRDAYVQCKDKNEKDVIANLMKLVKASTRLGNLHYSKILVSYDHYYNVLYKVQIRNTYIHDFCLKILLLLFL